MASKKYSFLAGLLCLFTSYGFAQTTTTTGSIGAYDPADSSVIPSRRMPQHTEFMNGTYNYPAKPKNMWEIGIKAGSFTVNGDVDGKFFSPGFGVHIRKAFGYLFSARLEYVYGIAKGLSWQGSSQTSYGQGGTGNPWQRLGYTGTVYNNYKSKVQDLSLEGLFSLNNIMFHQSRPKVNVYALVGVGASIYDVKVNALNGSTPYDFSGIPAGTYKTRKDVKDALKNLMDDSYETDAENAKTRRPNLFGKTLRPVGQLGGGIAFKLNNRVNLALEDRVSITKDDLYDGVQWTERGDFTRDFDTYNFLSLGLNFNIGSKSVEPLWWINPLDYAYQEIRKPRLMILPKPVLPDADGDGITDQFDQEQTPQGVPVDSHGVSLDTDGDGVPDARDKEKITPTYCQPVDADGVGKCPCPDSTCFAGYTKTGACEAALGTLPSVTFSGNGVSLNNDAKALLASVASRLRNSPECKIVVTGYCASSKSEQQRSWDRVNAVISYMVEKEGISQDRFFWNYGQEGGDCNTIDLRAAASDEQGQTTVPAPHPNLRRSK
ncbi:OmpA family protein [Flavisolibacter ginsengisoli]|uniref:Outer membrane protein OmpA n=1 Tax=Flavisolibacter ginsengisoli DSM 18119 TaxID=1121884 RepID=A0A1M5FBS2_9BACT|nr:OmpA family protein [Flavisolibacter ginsengisoli]SHF88858.1 Outer membrane protein OmpA [Flavisolibacter ginsengisoli DSM 18119]